jgi:ribonuclease HI
MGLEALLQVGAKKIEILSDSQLLVRQLNGEYELKMRSSKSFLIEDGTSASVR